MQFKNRTPMLLALIIGILFVMTACDELNEIKEAFSFEIPSGQIAASALDVDTKNGSIEVFYWNESFIRVEGEKKVSGLGDLESEMGKIDINYDFKSDQLYVYASFPDDMNKLFKNKSYGANLIVYIPKGVAVFNDFHANTSNGRIIMEGFDGAFDLRTSNGSIELTDCTGSIKAKTSNASVDLSNIKGEMDITTSNGSIKLSKSFLTGSYNHFNTSNARINGEITLPLSGSVSFITSNGSINLTVPENTGADFTANTSNGSISIKGMSVNYSNDGKTAKSGRINDGGVRLELKTSNGSISLGL